MTDLPIERLCTQNDMLERVSRLKERLAGQFYPRHINPSKNYAERDAFEIVVEFTLDGGSECYEAFITRIPSTRRLNNCELVVAGKFPESPLLDNGRHIQNLVWLERGETKDSLQRLAIPSLVQIKRLNDGPDGFREFVYYCPKSGRLKHTVAPRSWDISLRSRYVEPQHLHDSNQLVEDVSRHRPVLGEYFLGPEHHVYDVFAGADLTLNESGGWITFGPRDEKTVELKGFFCGPVDYATNLVKCSS